MSDQTLETLIRALADRSIRLWVENGALKFTAPADSMDAALKTRLRTHREALVSLLESTDASTATPRAAAAAVMPLDRAARRGPLPASSEQRRLWHMEHLEPNGAYSLPLAIRIRGDLDRDRMQDALTALTERHDAFRTRLGLDDVGTVVQILDAEPRVSRHEHTCPEASVEETLRALAAEPLRCDTGPIGRVHLLRIAQNDHILLIVLHHVVTDGWSTTVILRDLLRFYADGPDSLAPLRMDFAAFVAHRDSGPADTAARTFWTEHLTGAPSLSGFPGDRPRGRVRAARPGAVARDLSAEHSGAFDTFLKEHGVSAFSALSAVQALAIAILSGQRDVVIGAPTANRNGPPEIETCVGFFANTLANRFDIDLSVTALDLVTRTDRHMRAALSHQSFPFDEAVTVSGVDRTPAWTPLVQTVLAVQTFPIEDLTVPGLSLSPLPVDPPAARFDWTTQAFQVDGCWRLHCEYDAGLYSTERAAAILDTLVSTLERMLATPTAHLDDIAAPLRTLLDRDRPMQLGRAVLDRYVPPRRHRAMLRGSAEGRAVLSLFLEGQAPPWQTRDEIAMALHSLVDMDSEIVPVGSWPLTGRGDTDLGRLAELPMMPAHHIAALEAGPPTVRLAPVPAPVPALDGIDLTDLDPAITGRSVKRRTLALLAPPPSGEAVLTGAPLNTPGDWPETLPEALAATARRYPDHGLTLVDHDGRTSTLTYADLYEAGLSVAAGLVAEGIRPGDPVILLIPSLPAFFPALWGCILAGAVPVAVAQPRRASMYDAVFAKLVGAWTLLRHPLILCEAETLAVLDAGRDAFGGQAPKAIRVDTLQAHAPLPGPVASHPEAIALLQLTSGSTGMAKGVQIRQKGVATHVSLVREANGYTADWKSLNWLPHDHVGALLTYHLADSWLGCAQVVVATDLVLKDPGLWLDLIEAHRVTRSWSPNFGFKLVLNHAARHPEKRWDLSCLRFLMNGGEQVTPSVLRDFEAFLIRNGALAGVMQPAFGMAEACSTVTYENAFSAATGIRAYDKGVLETGQASGEVIELVSLGAVVPGCSLKIVDAQGRTLPERRVGRFLIHGDVVTPGYFDNPEATAACLVGGGWLDSGDLAFIDRGRLFMTGRSKETIILNGANYYCHEFEDALNDIPGILPTYAAAVGIREPEAPSESLALIFASDLEDAEALAPVIVAARQRIVDRFAILPAYCLPLTRDTFPKGTSGKIQRARLKAEIEDGTHAALIARFGQTRAAATEPPWLATTVWRRDAGQALTRPPAAVTKALDPNDADAALGTVLDRLESFPSHPPVPLIFGVPETGPRAHPLAGAVAALAESAMLRDPDRDVRCVLVETAERMEEVLAREAALKAPLSAALVRVDARGHRWTRHLSPVVPGEAPIALTATTPVMVVGGLGAIGAALAADLLQRTEAPVIVAGRTREGKRAETWTQLREIDSDRVSFIGVCDDGTLPPVDPAVWDQGGLVINAVGGGGDATPLSRDTLTTAMAAKVAPAAAVEAAFADHPGVTIVHVGSVTGLLGGLGVEAYAAAHGWLDALATGCSRRVVAFSQWRNTGVSQGHAPLDARAAHGMRSLSPEQAVRLFWIALSSGHPLVDVGLDLTAPGLRRRSTHTPVGGEAWLVFGGAPETAWTDAAGRPLPIADTLDAVDGTPTRDQLSSEYAATPPPSANTRIAPRAEAERILHRIWVEVLEHDTFGVADNFFAVGGSSLLLVRVHKAVEETFGRTIPVVALYQHPTIAALATHLGTHLATGDPTSPSSSSSAVDKGAERAARRRGARRRGGQA